MAQEKQKQINSQNASILAWKAPEFGHHPKSKQWFLIAGVLMILLIAYAILTNSATMAIVFIVLGGVYYLTHRQRPQIIDVQITELGIYAGRTFYPYNTINAFWIVYHPPFVSTLNLQLSSKTNQRVVIQLNQQNPIEVRKLLANEIPEIEGEQESLTDIATRLLRL